MFMVSEEELLKMARECMSPEDFYNEFGGKVIGDDWSKKVGE